MKQSSDILADYERAFSDPSEGDRPFLIHHSAGDGHPARMFTRAALWARARRAATVLRACPTGAAVTHFFTANRPDDLAFRLGAAMAATVPVTVNWQADDLERVSHKVGLTGSRLLVTDSGVPEETLEVLKARHPQLEVFASERLDEVPELGADSFRAPDEGEEADRIVIFTSGTTSLPKGVRLSYRAYRTNRATFESFLRIGPADDLTLVAVNPLHHGNATAISDWAMRRPGTTLHLVERYSTRYWQILAEAAQRASGRIVAPTVSRHFDFLQQLQAEGRLPLPEDELRDALRRVVFLMGSAPVGPATVQRVREWTGSLPVVRFGSTETCLQVLGTPSDMAPEETEAAFERGWRHQRAGREQGGYYIGRPHHPHTDVRVVRGVAAGEDGYLVDCEPGEPGLLVATGGNLMTGYVADEAGTTAVMADGWYTGLGDICYWLASPTDGKPDWYWMCRESALLIRGGANYSCEQVAAELRAFIEKRYGLAADGFDLAVVGLCLRSEHDDDCCVVVDLSAAGKAREVVEAGFLADARAQVSRGARPDRVAFGPVPRNFKGAVVLPELKKLFVASPEIRGGVGPGA